jgi:tubulin-specific chaperone B
MSFDLADPSSVPKYTMSEESYSKLPDSVLAWKKTNKLGRFDPSAPEIEASKASALWQAVQERHISVGARCQLGTDSTRRGFVRFVGEVAELPGPKGGAWVGVELDEPVGRNDGSVVIGSSSSGSGGGDGEVEGEGEGQSQGEAKEKKKKVYFQCAPKKGVFVRPERVVVGDFEVLGLGDDDDDDGIDDELNEDMEEI